eukprot:356777-Chlamydomonas_euryale.AAC.1
MPRTAFGSLNQEPVLAAGAAGASAALATSDVICASSGRHARADRRALYRNIFFNAGRPSFRARRDRGGSPTGRCRERLRGGW